MLIDAGRLPRVLLLTGLLAGVAMAAAPGAFAQQAGAEQKAEEPSAADIEPKQVPLDAKKIEAFIAAWPEFEALREKLVAQNPDTANQDKNKPDQPESDEAEVGEAEDPVGALAAYLDDPKAKPEIEAILKKNGFATYSDWADVAQSVMLAFGASDQEGATDLAAEKKKVQEEIQNDAALSADEKKSALKDLDEQFAALESFQPLPGNVDVAKPYFAKIKDLFGDDDDDAGEQQKGPAAPAEGDKKQ